MRIDVALFFRSGCCAPPPLLPPHLPLVPARSYLLAVHDGFEGGMGASPRGWRFVMERVAGQRQQCVERVATACVATACVAGSGPGGRNGGRTRSVGRVRGAGGRTPSVGRTRSVGRVRGTGAAPAAPHSIQLGEAFSKGWSKGWNEGYAFSYGKGYDDGFGQGKRHSVTLTGKKGKKDEWEDEESESTSGEKKKKKKKQKGASRKAWKVWRDAFPAANEDTDEPIYCVKLGTDTYEVYPQEIQEKLRAAADEVERGANSKTVEYDMTGGWVFNLRIFDAEEKNDWTSTLNKILDDGDVEPVGAQWDKNKATEDPPDTFLKGLTYRPILIKKK